MLVKTIVCTKKTSTTNFILAKEKKCSGNSYFKEICMKDDDNDVETDVFKKRKIKMYCIFFF